MNLPLHNLAAADDRVLVDAAVDGSAQAFDLLARRYQVPLLRYLRRRTPNRADAEDVLQETLLRAFEKLPQCHGGRFRSWIYAIARNIAIDHNRRLIRPMPTARPSASEDRHKLDEQEASGALWETARSLLSDDQFEAMWLYYVESLSTVEVGRVMGRSWVSVKALLSRGRRRIAPHVARIYGIEVALAVAGES